METKNSYKCPIHVTYNIEKLDPDASSKKLFYCIMCVLEAEDPKVLSKTLQDFKYFISTAHAVYISNKAKQYRNLEVPAEYTEVLSRKAETLNKLTNHLEKQKQIVEILFEERKVGIIKQIEQEKNRYLQILDEELAKASNAFTFFEKQLKKSYPKSEDLEELYPSKEELEKRLSKVENVVQLTTFVQNIKEDINQRNETTFFEVSDDDVKHYFNKLCKDLKKVEVVHPSFKIKDLNANDFEGKFKAMLDEFDKKTFELTSQIQFDSEAIGSQSQIGDLVDNESLKLLKEWLPEKYGRNLTLIYKATKDGFGGDRFHALCDSKGPTVSVIKCQFNGSDKTSLIGGFADKDWNQSGAYLQAKDSFIFSLSNRSKCRLVQVHNAIFCQSGHGPTFGGGHDICMADGQGKSYVSPHSFEGTARIIDSVNYFGEGKVKFVTKEVEVYSVK